MASRRKSKAQKSFWARMDSKSRMYFVLAVCFGLVALTSAAAFLVVHGLSGGTSADNALTDADSMVDESGYDKDRNTIDTTQYASTILEETEDAGQDYVDETLFLGDSNTARMYRMFDYCTYDNAIGSVGMSARSLATYECVKFDGLSGYKTMPEAVAIMQPRRVIITFGTNDLSPSNSTGNFIESYKKGIKAVEEAYPSVDIIINSIPPLGKQHSNQSLTQTQVDEYNQALVELCEKNDWKFLNSTEVLKDPSTGYAKSGYVESSDGIHLTRSAMDALFEYIRTHSYITEDDRPALTTVPEHIDDKDVSATTASSVVTSTSTATAAPSSSESESESQSESQSESSSVAPTPTPTPTYTWTQEVVKPTCTTQGYTRYICNEDSSKNYIDQNSYVAALGHDVDATTGKCKRCGEQIQQPAGSASSGGTTPGSESTGGTTSGSESTGDTTSGSESTDNTTSSGSNAGDTTSGSNSGDTVDGDPSASSDQSQPDQSQQQTESVPTE